MASRRSNILFVFYWQSLCFSKSKNQGTFAKVEFIKQALDDLVEELRDPWYIMSDGLFQIG